MIHIERLTKYYDRFCAVDGISLDIDRGEIVGLLGPNGAGKTTTLRMLTGFFKPTSGHISVKNLNMDDHPLEIKRLIGYLPESAPLYHGMLVYDYLDYIARIRGFAADERPRRIDELATLCDIRDILHKPIAALSKGLKQRVGLAHAMMKDPEILILDEPTSGLDPNQIVEIREIIRRIGKEKTVILSTHILSEAEATCDRIVIINRGKIIADGSADDLKRNAGSERFLTVSLANADANAVTERLSAIDGVAECRPAAGDRTDELTVRVTFQSERDLRGVVYEEIKKTDWVILAFSEQSRSLETIFRELTRES